VRHGLFYRRVFRPTVAAVLPADKQTLRWHDLRHTCASLSLAVAPNLHLVKERLGHEDIRTTVSTYGHMVPSVDAALADGLGALFDSAASAAPASNVVVLR
jgi:integrase